MAEDGGTFEAGIESQDTGGEQQQEQAQPTQDNSYQEQFNARLEELSAGQRQLYEQLLAQQQYGDDDYDEYDDAPDEGDPEYEQYVQQQQMAELVEQMVAERVRPLQVQQAIQQRDSAYDSLVNNIPALADEKVARPILEAAVNFAQNELGLDPNQFLNSPTLVRLMEITYKAQVADQRAEQEEPAGSRSTASLESSGGAAPSEGEGSLEERLMELAKQSGGL